MTCLLCLVLAAAPSQAGDILVTGKVLSPEEQRREVQDYVRKTGVVKGETPMARWVVPVCPKVYGVAKPVAARVEQHVRAVAAEAGIRTARAKCAPNIAIAFVDDGAGFTRTMNKKSIRHVTDMTLHDKRELLTSEAAIRWWYAKGTGPSDRSGSTSGGPIAAGVAGGEGGQSVIAGVAGSASSISGGAPSLIRTGVVRTIATATVVIDVNRANGIPLDAVADYAAYVSLVRVDPPKIAPPQSVLGLFAGSADGLTERDRAFLASVYRIPLDREAYQQRGRLAGKIRKAERQSVD